MTTVSQYSDPEMPWRYRLMRISLVRGVLWGYRLGRQTIRPFNLGGSLERKPAGVACSVTVWPTFPGEPRGFFPAAKPAVVGGDSRSAHLWMEDSIRVSCLVVDTISNICHFMGCYPTVFWPMNHDLYYAASGKIVRSDAELTQMARRWVTYDWWRVAGIALSFISSIRALSLPIVAKSSS